MDKGLEYPLLVFFIAAVWFSLALFEDKVFKYNIKIKFIRNILTFFIISFSFFYIIDTKTKILNLEQRLITVESKSFDKD